MLNKIVNLFRANLSAPIHLRDKVRGVENEINQICRVNPDHKIDTRSAIVLLDAIHELHELSASNSQLERCTSILKRVAPDGKLRGSRHELLGNLPEAIKGNLVKLEKNNFLYVKQLHQFVYCLRVLLEGSRFPKNSDPSELILVAVEALNKASLQSNVDFSQAL